MTLEVSAAFAPNPVGADVGAVLEPFPKGEAKTLVDCWSNPEFPNPALVVLPGMPNPVAVCTLEFALISAFAFEPGNVLLPTVLLETPNTDADVGAEGVFPFPLANVLDVPNGDGAPALTFEVMALPPRATESLIPNPDPVPIPPPPKGEAWSVGPLGRANGDDDAKPDPTTVVEETPNPNPDWLLL